MKKLLLLLVITSLLTGCAAQETFETISDLNDIPVIAQTQQLDISLPEDAAVMSMEGAQEGKLYMCDGYTIAVQTMDSGDLNRTLQQLTGYDKSQLTVMKTRRANADCYECVWSAAGETGDQIGRGMILDDSSYHYTVTVMAAAEDAGNLSAAWQNLFDSVNLISTD